MHFTNVEAAWLCRGALALLPSRGRRHPRGGQALPWLQQCAVMIRFRFVSIIGKVESLWRYPVKSMRGEELDEAFARLFWNLWRPALRLQKFGESQGFPYFTAREQRRLVQYRPRFRYPEKAARPINLTEAEGKNANPLLADLADLVVDVETPEGQTLAIDDPALIESSERTSIQSISSH